MIPTWAVFAAVSVVGLVGAELSQKISMRKIEDVSAEANNFIVWLTISVIGFTFAIIGGQMDISILRPVHLLYFAVIGVLYFWGGTLFYSSYKGLSAAEGSTLVTVSIIVGTLLGIALLGEPASVGKFMGITLVIAAIFLLNLDDLKFSPNRYTTMAISGGAIYGVAYTVDKALVLEMNAFMYTALFSLSIAIVSLVFSFNKIRTDLLQKARTDNYKQMFMSGIAFSVFNLFTFLAYTAGGSVGSVDAINNTVVFWILGIEFVFMKERKSLARKALAAMLAFIAVILVIYA